MVRDSLFKEVMFKMNIGVFQKEQRAAYRSCRGESLTHSWVKQVSGEARGTPPGHIREGLADYLKSSSFPVVLKMYLAGIEWSRGFRQHYYLPSVT